LGNKYESVVKAPLGETFIRDFKFYSKRLNIAIFTDSLQLEEERFIHKLMIIDMRGRVKPIIIENLVRIPYIRTFKDEDKEILRVFI